MAARKRKPEACHSSYTGFRRVPKKGNVIERSRREIKRNEGWNRGEICLECIVLSRFPCKCLLKLSYAYMDNYIIIDFHKKMKQNFKLRYFGILIIPSLYLESQQLDLKFDQVNLLSFDDQKCRDVSIKRLKMTIIV